MKQFKKLALATAMSAGALGVSGQASAYMEGLPGEAQLVPFAVYSSELSLDTLVGIYVPADLGQDTLIREWTAPHLDWTDNDTFHQADAFTTELLKPYGEDGAQQPVPAEYIEWTAFDVQSQHLLDGKFKVTPDDVHIFDWRDHAGGQHEDQLVYLVFQTGPGAAGQDANMAFYAETMLVEGLDGVGPGGRDLSADSNTNPGFYANVTHIPTLAMNDGADAGQDAPSVFNNVVGRRASPIVTGTRLANGDGDGADSVEVAMFFGPRKYTQNMEVAWLDDNYGHTAVDSIVFDENEDVCSDTQPMPYELNVTLIGAVDESSDLAASSPMTHMGSNLLSRKDDVEERLCVPEGLEIHTDWSNYWDVGPAKQFGGKHISLPEGNDVAGVGASSAGVFFTLTFVGDDVFFHYDDDTWGKEDQVTETLLRPGMDKGKINVDVDNGGNGGGA